MKFEDVLPALRAGKKVKRKGWLNPTLYAKITGRDPEILGLYPVDSDRSDRFEALYASVLQDDWEVVEEKRELSWEEIADVIVDFITGRPLMKVEYIQLRKHLGFGGDE